MGKEKVICVIVFAAALLVLAALEIRKKTAERKEKKSLTQSKKPVNGRDLQIPAAGSRTGVPEKSREPDRTDTYDTGRTMLLSYTTLILTDVEHTARKYRAELFQPVLIGRDSGNDIVLEDLSVSRRHLRVYREGALVYAENLSSVNQTMLNGKILKEPSELVSGSRVKIGRYCFQVEID